MPIYTFENAYDKVQAVSFRRWHRRVIRGYRPFAHKGKWVSVAFAADAFGINVVALVRRCQIKNPREGFLAVQFGPRMSHWDLEKTLDRVDLRLHPRDFWTLYGNRVTGEVGLDDPESVIRGVVTRKGELLELPESLTYP